MPASWPVQLQLERGAPGEGVPAWTGSFSLIGWNWSLRSDCLAGLVWARLGWLAACAVSGRTWHASPHTHTHRYTETYTERFNFDMAPGSALGSWLLALLHTQTGQLLLAVASVRVDSLVCLPLHIFRIYIYSSIYI